MGIAKIFLGFSKRILKGVFNLIEFLESVT